MCLALFFPTLSISKTAQDIPITGWSKDPAIEAFDAKFITFIKKWRLPGVAVAIIKDGQFIAERGYGWADKERGQPIQPDSLFRIASVSKTFTTVAILKLIEQGKIRLDDKVFDILNDLTPLPSGHANPQIHQITVQNLLQMSSGWFTKGASSDPLFGPWFGKIKATLSPELPASCETVVRFMMSMPLKHKPGTHYAYSNTDYCILGLIINKVAGTRYGYQGYENYLNREILYPLNIRNMFIGSTQLKYKMPKEVTYYKESKASPDEGPDHSFYLPYGDTELLKKNFSNGGWVASAEDVAWFIENLKQFRILSPASLDLMKTKPSFRPKEATSYYTMGGQIYHDKAGREYWIQTGSFTGTNAFVISKPNGTTIAVLFNIKPFNLFAQFRPELKNILMNSNF
jgi:N-acyl-D-amino-acid deacylase